MGSQANTRRAAAITLAAGIAITGCAVGCSVTHRSAPAAPRAAVALAAYHDCSSLLNGLRAATSAQAGQLESPHGPGRLPYANGLDAPRNPLGGTAQQSHSTTNVQEAGVDEPDTVKTDGGRIVTVARGELRVIDAATHQVTGSIGISGGVGWSPAEILMSGDRVLVVTRPAMMYASPQNGDVPGPVTTTGPQFTLVDISGAPRILSTMTVRGTYVDARQVGSVVRIVVRSSPNITIPMQSSGPASERKAIQQAPLSDWLTSYTVTSNGRSLTRSVPCGQVSHLQSSVGSSMVTMLTVDLSGDMTDLAPASVVATADTIYGTTGNLYITDRPWPGPVIPSPRTTAVADRTNIYEFGLSGSKAPKFEAAGAVSGTLSSQYSLSEYNGDLRVAATSDSQTSVDVLARHGDQLVQVGKVSGLGKGEQVYAVRFIGPAGYVVTYRQVDPLFTLDLSDPAKPRLTGKLTIDGYSAYLHPLADGRLLGVGQQVTQARPVGLQVSLFDIRAPAHPNRITGYQVGSEVSAVDFDPHAFLYWPATGLTVLPVTGPSGDQTLVLSVSANDIRKIGTIRPPVGALTTQRSILIGNTLWTITTAGAQANDATTLAKTAWLPF